MSTGILERMIGSPMSASARNAADDYWYRPVGGLSQAGVRVSAHAAQRIGTFYACNNVVAEDLASVPFRVWNVAQDGSRDRAVTHPLYRLLHDRPNRWQTSYEWREMLQGHVAMRGKAVCRIVEGERGPFSELIPIHPLRVRIEQEDSGDLVYLVKHNDGTEERLLGDEALLIRGKSEDGVEGIGLLEYSIDSLGLASSLEGFASRWFTQGAAPPAVLQTDKVLSNKAHRRLRNSMNDNHSGPSGWHQFMILEEGMTWQQIGVSAEAAQLTDARKLQDLDILKFWRMQPHKVGILDHATFSNIEHQGIEHSTDTMRPWAVRWEMSCERDLILPHEEGTIEIELDLDGLVRGDIKSRYESHASAISWGWKNRNEIRRTEGLNRVDGLDEFMEPRNMAPAGGQGGNGGSPAEAAAARYFAQQASSRLVHREVEAMKRAAKAHGNDMVEFAVAVDEFYDGHQRALVEQLNLPPAIAARYTDAQRAQLRRDGIKVLSEWEQSREHQLAELSLGEFNVYR